MKLSTLYSQLLSVYTLRLCDLEPESVEAWVKLDFFPTRDCLQICIERKNYEGIAILKEKVGDGKEAIVNYTKYIESID